MGLFVSYRGVWRASFNLVSPVVEALGCLPSIHSLAFLPKRVQTLLTVHTPPPTTARHVSERDSQLLLLLEESTQYDYSVIFCSISDVFRKAGMTLL